MSQAGSRLDTADERKSNLCPVSKPKGVNGLGATECNKCQLWWGGSMWIPNYGTKNCKKGRAPIDKGSGQASKRGAKSCTPDFLARSGVCEQYQTGGDCGESGGSAA